MTDQRKVQLLPCPWCGDGEGVLSAYPNDHATSGGEVGIPHVDAFFVHCDGCGADGPVEDTHGGAIEVWNTRQAALAHASSATTNPQGSSSRLVDAAVLAELTAWLTREMPAGTIISSPGWWAKRIAGRVHIAIDQAIAGVRGDGNG